MKTFPYQIILFRQPQTAVLETNGDPAGLVGSERGYPLPHLLAMNFIGAGAAPDPSRDQSRDEIVLEFSAGKVNILGRNLGGLWEALAGEPKDVESPYFLTVGWQAQSAADISRIEFS